MEDYVPYGLFEISCCCSSFKGVYNFDYDTDYVLVFIVEFDFLLSIDYIVMQCKDGNCLVP